MNTYPDIFTGQQQQSHIYVYGTIRACGLSRAEFEAFWENWLIQKVNLQEDLPGAEIAVPPHQSVQRLRSAARSTRPPRRYTSEIVRVFLMSSSGFASRTTKSALFPDAIVPSSVRPRC